MRLEYTSRTGRFNFCNPTEESTRTAIRVYDNDNNLLKNTSITTENEENDNDIDQAIYLLEEADRRVLFATDQQEWKEMIAFLKENYEEIEKGNKEYRIRIVKEKIEKLQNELSTLVTNRDDK